MVALIYARWQIDTQTWCPLAEPEGGKGGHLSPWLLLNFFSNSSLNSKVVTFWHGGKKKLKKRTSTWLKVTKPLLLSCPIATFTYFTIFYFISLFTSFLLYIIFFTAFYSWMILEILQILLLMSYKLACHKSQKIISNIYSLYFLSNTNHILTPSVYKLFSSYELVILFIYFNNMKYIHICLPLFIYFVIIVG